ncbi:MAG: hypothetical protein R2861_14020 [Desulfobacterales bacterium]
MVTDEAWAAPARDLKRAGQFNIVSYFATGAEPTIEKPFSGDTAALTAAGGAGGCLKLDVSYDVVMQFLRLPAMLCSCSLMTQMKKLQHHCLNACSAAVEFYLDPESPCHDRACLAKRLGSCRYRLKTDRLRTGRLKYICLQSSERAKNAQ